MIRNVRQAASPSARSGLGWQRMWASLVRRNEFSNRLSRGVRAKRARRPKPANCVPSIAPDAYPHGAGSAAWCLAGTCRLNSLALRLASAQTFPGAFKFLQFLLPTITSFSAHPSPSYAAHCCIVHVRSQRPPTDVLLGRPGTACRWLPSLR